MTYAAIAELTEEQGATPPLRDHVHSSPADYLKAMEVLREGDGLPLERLVDALEQLPNDWDSYGAPRPERSALVPAKQAIRVAHEIGLDPVQVVPASEGGVALCFTQGDKYADLEFLNDGNVFSAVTDRQGFRQVWPVAVNQIREALERIREFLGR
jgi:hypothetical protein